MISTLLKESKTNTMTSQASHIPRLRSADSVATYKALKTIRGSLEAAFELSKVFKCSMVLKS